MNRLLSVLVAASVTAAPIAVTAPALAASQFCTGAASQTFPKAPSASPFAGSSFGSSKSGGNTGPSTVTRKGVGLPQFTEDSPTQVLQLITGPGSPDRTDKKWDLTATDLGFAYDDAQGNTNLVFGDSFDCRTTGDGWRSNAILRTQDRNYGDGLRVSSALTSRGYTSSGSFVPVWEGLHRPDRERTEVTKIPTSGITVNGTQYLDFMSVRQWSTTGGAWETNFAQVMKSNDGVKWTPVKESLRRQKDSGVGFALSDPKYTAGNEKLQMSAYAQDDQYVYRFSTPSGRFSSAIVGRAPKSQFPNESAFRYWNGKNWNSTSATQAATVIDGKVSELSIAYSSYLNKWVALYLVDGRANEPGTGLVMRTADSLAGTWSEPTMLVSKKTQADLYGGFILPNQDDQHLYYVATTWSGYNVMLMRSNLDEVVKNTAFEDNITVEKVVKVADLPSQ